MLLGGIVAVGVILLAVLGIVFLVTRKPKNGPIPLELANLPEEVAQLRAEILELKRGRPSTDIKPG